MQWNLGIFLQNVGPIKQVLEVIKQSDQWLLLEIFQWLI